MMVGSLSKKHTDGDDFTPKTMADFNILIILMLCPWHLLLEMK